MSISIQKCVVLKHGHPDLDYALHGMTLPTAQFTLGLGVIVFPDLDFGGYIHAVAISAGILVSTIFRCLAATAPDSCIQLFNTIVILKVLYAVPIWNPRLQTIELFPSECVLHLHL